MYDLFITLAVLAVLFLLSLTVYNIIPYITEAKRLMAWRSPKQIESKRIALLYKQRFIDLNTIPPEPDVNDYDAWCSWASDETVPWNYGGKW